MLLEPLLEMHKKQTSAKTSRGDSGHTTTPQQHVKRRTECDLGVQEPCLKLEQPGFEF